MAVTLKFTKSGSTDVVGYRLYAAKAGENLADQTEYFDLGNPTPDENGVCSVDLMTLEGISAIDGTYDLGITAVDDFGMESPMLTEGLANITLDFVAPDPPTNASISFQ